MNIVRLNFKEPGTILDFLNKIQKMLDELPKDNKKPIANVHEQVGRAFFIDKIAERRGWNYEKTKGWLKNLYCFYPAAALNIILREIAIYLDHQYEDTINHSKEIYVISLLDGEIKKADKSKIKNYRNFAAFRTMKDAEEAKKIVKPLIDYMFSVNAGKQENKKCNFL